MSGPLPGVVRCLGPLGCRQLVDLGAVEATRGARAILHLRDDPAHVEQGVDLSRLLSSIAFVAA